MRSKRTMKRSLRNLTVILLMILAFCSGFLGHTLLNARAEEKAIPELKRYYTSVQIRQGDSLWDLAGQYCQGSPYTKTEYEASPLNKIVNHQGRICRRIKAHEWSEIRTDPFR